MRLACLYVPDLAVQAALRRAPELRDRPLALTDAGRAQESATAEASGNLGRRQKRGARGNGNGSARSGRARIVVASAEARQRGVRPGMTAAQASAACPGLALLALEAADVDAAEAALADVGFAFAPRIERERARVFFDAGDLGQLYPSEAAVSQAIQARAARVGLGVRVAIAGAKGTARIATRARELAVVPPGGDAAFLAPLPVRFADEAIAAEHLSPWGIATLGALAALPAADVALRLGQDGARLHRLARGDDDEPFLPSLPADAVEEGVTLDYAVDELEPLTFILRGLVDRVLARLGCRGLACAGITLRLATEARAFDVREVGLAAPTRETGPLVQLARLDLARRPPDAPIVAVLVVARPARVRAAQLDFLRPAGPAPDRLAATITRLAALVGPDNVGAPRAEDTWREEAVGVASFAPGDEPRAGAGAESPATTTTLAIRRFRPPEEIEVMLGPDGPAALRGKETTARILVAAGPYRLSGEWWRRDDAGPRAEPDSAVAAGIAPTDAAGAFGFHRDYWDVHASDGAVYRLHHDRKNGRWYLDGYYD